MAGRWEVSNQFSKDTSVRKCYLFQLNPTGFPILFPLQWMLGLLTHKALWSLFKALADLQLGLIKTAVYFCAWLQHQLPSLASQEIVQDFALVGKGVPINESNLVLKKAEHNCICFGNAIAQSQDTHTLCPSGQDSLRLNTYCTFLYPVSITHELCLTRPRQVFKCFSANFHQSFKNTWVILQIWECNVKYSQNIRLSWDSKEWCLSEIILVGYLTCCI